MGLESRKTGAQIDYDISFKLNNKKKILTHYFLVYTPVHYIFAFVFIFFFIFAIYLYLICKISQFQKTIESSKKIINKLYQNYPYI